MAVVSGLHAAMMLARGRPDGVAQMQAEIAAGPQALRRSFWAMGVAFPAFLSLRLLDWQQNGTPAHAGHGLALDLLFYVIGWVGFVLLTPPIVARLGRTERWPLFIATWNWCNVAQYGLLVAAALPGLLGAPDFVAQTAGLVAVGWALWLEWYAARVALDVGAAPAAALVALDVGIGVALATLGGMIL